MTLDQLALEYTAAVAALQAAHAHVDRVLEAADQAGVSFNQLAARVEQMRAERDGHDMSVVED